MNMHQINILLDNEQDERLNALVERFKPINGWDAVGLLEFAFTAHMSMTNNLMLTFLEAKAEQLEKSMLEEEKEPTG